MTTRIAALLLALATAAPLSAQTRSSASSTDDVPAVSVRPFFLVAEQKFNAATTFDAIFGSASAPFVGGGVQVALRDGIFVELTASRFRKTGQRAFRFDNQNFGLGIPLTAKITPFEVAAGYRYRHWDRIVPYGGAGFGSYGYKETSGFADASENIDTRHTGFLVLGGAEFRLHRWVGVTADVQYTSIGGILGSSGISKDAGESNLGGTAARFRVIVGR